MKHTLIFVLCLISCFSVLTLHGMDNGRQKPIYKGVTTSGNHQMSGDRPTHRQRPGSSYTPTQTAQSHQLSAHNRPALTPQEQKPTERPITILKRSSQSDDEDDDDDKDLFIPFQPETSSEEEQTTPPNEEQPSVSIDIKTIERLALMAEILPKILAQNAEDKHTIQELKRELLTQAQRHHTTLRTIQLHHNQQIIAQTERHHAACRELHKEFDAKLLAKQLTYNTLVESQTAAYNNVMQAMIYQHQLLYALCVQSGIIQILPKPQAEENADIQENTAMDNTTGSAQDSDD